MLEYRRDEALRYFRAAPGDEAAGVLLDVAYLKLRNEVEARHVLLRQGIHVDADGVTLGDGTRFTSKDLARHVRGCEEALLFAATLGSRVDIAVRRLSLVSVAEGAAAQAVAAALIERYCDDVLARTDTGALCQRSRFSPGYGDWALSEQVKLHALLHCAKRIGLTLTSGLMMAPTKSVTAIVGLSKEVVQGEHKCAHCMNVNCPYRVIK